ncbi:GerAB/ArcD/ProY family transporter [Bacillus sp. NTK071]|uniref:GerAB/ArcD/ProY family transporter n=1 Tax=Bacillus sp. NTK071 TaxID=2802175 RepID=UPI001A8F2124|nr:GerAB/ArcD/ProY family transporter [Bacillus sp. NTK071]MBN8210554.1 GerAB/ArcD/ProY family transporter [Bacillus sp. NTK071]
MNENQSSLPMIIFLISTIIGVGIVTLPRETAVVVGQPNMWISVIFGASVAFLNALLIFMLIKRYPNQTLFDFAPHVIGKWIGKLFNLIFVTYAIFISAFVIRTMSEIVNYYLLDRTPKFVVLIVLILSCMYLVSCGLSNIVMFFQLYFPIILAMFFLLTILSIKSIEPTNLRPIFVNDGYSLLKGTHTTFFSFVGYELIMVLSGYQKLTKWGSVTKILGISIGSVCMIYVLFFILNIGILSIGELKVITFPTIEMAKTIEYQGFFFERFELLFLFGWIITIFTTLTAYYYSALLGICKTFNCQRNIFVNIIVGMTILSLSLYPSGITELFSTATYTNNLSYAALIVIPLILLVVSVTKERFQ